MEKEVEYNFDGTIANTYFLTYEKGKLTRKKQIYGHNNAYNELLYEYDKNNNELQWMKVFDSKDTSCVYKNIYKDNLLIETIGIEGSELSSNEYYEYSEGKLIKIKQHDKNGILKIFSDFYYNKKGEIDYVYKINKYMGITSTSKYYYE